MNPDSFLERAREAISKGWWLIEPGHALGLLLNDLRGHLSLRDFSRRIGLTAGRLEALEGGRVTYPPARIWKSIARKIMVEEEELVAACQVRAAFAWLGRNYEEAVFRLGTDRTDRTVR